MEHDPGYGDRFVIVNNGRTVTVICNDKNKKITIEYYKKPNYTDYGMEFLDYDVEEYYSDLEGVDTKGF
jgi:ribosomal protein L24E